MKRALLLLVTIITLSSSLSAQRSLPDPPPLTLKSDVNEVRLAFAAIDSSGRVVTQLSAADVAVIDNGETIRSFRSFRPAAEVPLNLVILIDASGSVASDFPRVVAELNEFFARARWGPNDRVSIMAFGGSWPTLICAAKCANEIARLPLKSIHAGGSTPLYDALADAAKLFARQHDPESRPALVLFSDGFDTISLKGAQNALDSMRNAEATVYTKTVSARRKTPDGEAFLAELTEGTGGLRFPPIKTVDATLATVVQDLRSGFVLTYNLPRAAVEQHTVQVRVTNPPDLKIRSRNSYRVTQDHVEQSRGTQ